MKTFDKLFERLVTEMAYGLGDENEKGGLEGLKRFLIQLSEARQVGNSVGSITQITSPALGKRANANEIKVVKVSQASIDASVTYGKRHERATGEEYEPKRPSTYTQLARFIAVLKRAYPEPVDPRTVPATDMYMAYEPGKNKPATVKYVILSRENAVLGVVDGRDKQAAESQINQLAGGAVINLTKPKPEAPIDWRYVKLSSIYGVQMFGRGYTNTEGLSPEQSIAAAQVDHELKK